METRTKEKKMKATKTNSGNTKRKARNKKEWAKFVHKCGPPENS